VGGRRKFLEVTMPCARWSVCQQQRSPFWNLSSVISTTMTAVALCSFRYPKIRGSELVPCVVVDRVGWFEKWVFRIPVFLKSVGNCWNFILLVPNVVSQDSNKRAKTLGANCCSQTRNGVSPSSQPIPLVAPVFKNKKPKRWAPNFWLYSLPKIQKSR
jgi:hypothetical protein